MQLIDSSITSQFERMPPNSIESEMCYLGSLMLSAADRAAMVTARQALKADEFFQADHAILFECIASMIDRSGGVDFMLLREELIRRNVLEEIGGLEYLATIANSVPNAANVLHYAGVVREKARLRELIALSNSIIRECYAPMGPEDGAEKLAMESAAKATRIAINGKSDRVHLLGDVATDVYASKERGECRFYPTGLADLDRLAGGILIGGKTIIGAKPGMGKSQLIKQIGLNVSRAGLRFGIISIEEDRYKIASNTMSNASDVPNARITFGKLDEVEWRKLAGAVADLSQLPFHIIDSARKLSAIIACIHQLKHQHKCQIIAVDHLHIIDGETNEHREREISKISAELKWVWKDLGIAGLEAAQLNRGSGKDRPGLSSLRDSGSLEQDADTVILLHREDYYRRDGESFDNVMEAIVAKNKNGAPGTVPLHYDGARQRIADCIVEDPFNA